MELRDKMISKESATVHFSFDDDEFDEQEKIKKGIYKNSMQDFAAKLTDRLASLECRDEFIKQ